MDALFYFLLVKTSIIVEFVIVKQNFYPKSQILTSLNWKLTILCEHLKSTIVESVVLW
jgi:hypothetical protein